ncbi:alpha/beta hydrolase [Methylobacterium sp. ap11]|uniref:alpha/beta fold hydrolase n=1 Tax=Methylobacterium sp. ap11 TaxID=1761799 RepID=UPI001FCD3FAC|nr:alpha/beta hydrolase [Methylobacterium sp. ap11]
MADDTVAVFRALGLGRVDLLGFSLGGFVAQQVALTQPDLVRRTILAGTGPAGGVGIDRVGGVSRPLILEGTRGPSETRRPTCFASVVCVPDPAGLRGRQRGRVVA